MKCLLLRGLLSTLLCIAVVLAAGATVHAEQRRVANPTTTASPSAAIGCPKSMPADVEQKLLPVLDALEDARHDWSNYRYGTRSEQNYETQFERLLSAKDKSSRQARVALMDYYVGEGPGEELVCVVALDGEGIVPFLNLYDRCDISPYRSPVPRERDFLLRQYVREALRDGHIDEDCENIVPSLEK
jgi:hypothetical protein